MMKIEESLKKKGWKNKDIVKASRVLKRGELKKSSFLHHFSFLTAFLVLIFGNFLLSIALIPFFLLTDVLYLFLILFALSFGVVFELIMFYFEEKRFHIFIAGILTPVIVFFNIYYITVFTNLLNKKTNNPLFCALIYSFVFLIPFISHKLIKTFK